MTSGQDFLFAYGTLRQDAPARGHAPPPEIAAALATAEHVGAAAAKGFLHKVGAFSAMAVGPGRVVGDVYRIDRTLWPMLDSYEGDAYVRGMFSVTLDTGDALIAYAYVARDPATLGPRIESGDFLNQT